MKAWPAVRELRIEGVVEGAVGLVMLVLAIALDAPLHWLVVVFAVVGVLATAYPARWQSKMVATVGPLPAGTSPVRGLRLLGRLPWLVVSAAVLPLLAFIAPEFLWVAAVVGLDSAIVVFVRAAVIARAERRHGASIVRVSDGAFEQDRYFLAAH
jgi:hypothetical protein